MDFVLFLLDYDAARVLGEDFLDWQRDGVHDVLAEIRLDVRLLEPVVADEFALAIADFDTWVAVGLAAVELLDIVVPVVADVLAESGLFVKLGLFPLRAVGVPDIFRTFMPGLEHRHSELVVLDYHKTGVSVGAVESIRVVLRLIRVPRVLGHDERMRGFDVPVVEHPLNRNMEEAENGVSVEEDDKLVVLDVIGQRRGLDPGGVAILKLVGVDELVVVAVDERIRVVVEDAGGNVIDVAPVVLALLKVLGRLERPGLEVEDQNVAAQRLLVARVRGQLDVAAIGLADKRFGGRGPQVVVEQADNLVDGRVGLVGERPSAVRVSQHPVQRRPAKGPKRTCLHASRGERVCDSGSAKP